MVLGWMRDSQLTTYLNEIFGPFAPEDREIVRWLESRMEVLTLAGGDDLFRLGDEGDAAYIVMSGRVRIVSEDGGGDEVTINEVGRGEVLGEMALFTGDSRSASAYAIRDTDLARITSEDFHHLMEHRPQSLRPLARLLAERLQRQTQVRLPKHVRGSSVALVALDGSVSLDQFALQLVSRLGALGSVAVLGSSDVDEALGRRGIAQSADDDPTYLRVSRWLHEREENYRYVIYLADADWSTWTERCLRQSDRILFVATAAGDPDSSEIEERLKQRWSRLRAPSQSLLLIHPPDQDRPRSTERWLQHRNLESIYHIRQDHLGDLERLARILGDRAVGLVLGGGGARGLAHLGVIRAMEELGIPIDMIGGSSVGAPVAVPTAQGHKAAEAARIIAHHFRAPLDYTLPVASLLTGRKISRSIEEGAGDWSIEDLWIPYLCVSTNLTTGKVVTHRRGNLARALRASVSIPGVFPPVPMDGDLLADGGVLNNLPMDRMRRINPSGPLIAVDVLPPKGPRAKSDFGVDVSGWGLAADRLLPWRRAQRVPSLGATIMRSMFVGSDGARAKMLDDGLADLYLNIRASGIGLLQFEKIKQVVEIGYEASLEPLREWLESGGLAGK
jgi:predicted acylesterase/phospholipase RssA/CRP-like cAMP-binding protein